MNIKQEILTEVRSRFIDPHGLDTLAGTYDGVDGELVMTYEDDPNTYTVAFKYSGQELRNFIEVLYTTVGKGVKEHHIALGVPNRDAFIAEVTE